jgi:sigma-B regulation protein RsbU (phosphoserine phosphatase)
MPFRRSRLRAHALRYVALAVLVVLTAAAFVRNIYDSLDLEQRANDYVRPPFHLGDGNWGAVALQSEAEAAGLRFGDAVLAVNNRPVDGFVVYYGALRQAKAGDQLQVQVRSPGGADNRARDLSIELKPYRGASGPAGSASDNATFILRVVVIPVVCILLGFWVAAVRIGDRSAWLLLALMLSLAVAVGASATETIYARSGLFQALFAGFRSFCGSLIPPALLLFGIVFPERLPLDRRVPWLKWIVVGYLVLVSALQAVNVALWMHHLAWANWSGRAIEFLTGRQGNFGAAVSMIALVGCAGSLGWKAIAAPSRDARRRLLLLFVGAIPGVLALLTFSVAGRLAYRLPAWSPLPLIAMILAFPLTMAYVIVVHRAMDVRVVIRQGLQYVLARGGIRATQIVFLVLMSVAAASLLSVGTSAARVVLAVSAVLAVAAIVERFADRLRRWVDRLFFREAYAADAILSDLATRVRTMVETRPLLETVAARIAESLHVPRIAILLKDGGTFRPAYAIGFGAGPSMGIPAGGATTTRLTGQPHVLVRFDGSDSWVQSTTGAERQALEELAPELLLPLSLNQNILGIMSLGPKQSEEPFSRTDLRLLDSVAAQTGLALENGRLMAAVAAEVAARAKQTRDIEIARDVQQRLFPHEYPSIPGFDYAGACRAALGVGGDYYDFIPVSKTRLGIAIGDVSGKGVPAALLMATLRAYLRGAQTVRHQTDLAEVMRNLNQLVYESSAENRYATFFYGELDLTSRELTYVNAGHNPPLVFRTAAGGQDVLRLTTGGPVIGLMEGCVYQQDRLTLAAGDVLVAFTDGVSEAMNAADEEWGEDRLKDAVQANGDLNARMLIDRLMISADEFVSGAPQHDDMTLLVVRAI